MWTNTHIVYIVHRHNRDASAEIGDDSRRRRRRLRRRHRCESIVPRDDERHFVVFACALSFMFAFSGRM